VSARAGRTADRGGGQLGQRRPAQFEERPRIVAEQLGDLGVSQLAWQAAISGISAFGNYENFAGARSTDREFLAIPKPGGNPAAVLPSVDCVSPQRL
jgi:hypothetical protein